MFNVLAKIVKLINQKLVIHFKSVIYTYIFLMLKNKIIIEHEMGMNIYKFLLTYIQSCSWHGQTNK